MQGILMPKLKLKRVLGILGLNDMTNRDRDVATKDTFSDNLPTKVSIQLNDLSNKLLSLLDYCACERMRVQLFEGYSL